MYLIIINIRCKFIRNRVNCNTTIDKKWVEEQDVSWFYKIVEQKETVYGSAQSRHRGGEGKRSKNTDRTLHGV